jgi:glutamate-1-semialdehyde aminotransferase
VKLVVADKGYDAERNHEYAQDVLGARTAIPVRAASRPKIKMRGRRRKRQAKDFDFGLLARGIHFHPDKPFYTCTEHTDEDVDQTLKVAEEVLKKMKS